jgi:hypothetical protein
MYLKGKKYISEYSDKEDFEKINAIDLGQKSFKIYNIDVEVLYWRKANAIHDWFVREVQAGVDDCQESYVSTEKLKILRDLCREVMANPEKANSILPTRNGFFFGDISYDEWYFMHIENTEKQLTEVLEDEEFLKRWELYYQSSW